jgi:hypothetical protein
MSNDDEKIPKPGLVGCWRKLAQDPGAMPYPDEIEFSEDGLYETSRRGRGYGFSIWDAGDYSVIDPGRARISTAHDKKVIYDYDLQDDELTFVDPQGKKVSYKRSP